MKRLYFTSIWPGKESLGVCETNVEMSFSLNVPIAVGIWKNTKNALDFYKKSIPMICHSFVVVQEYTRYYLRYIFIIYYKNNWNARIRMMGKSDHR
jgi:hypothetical protein